jgi:adenosylhomocysteinase
VTDYIVKNIELAEFGRKELDIAETEMPGLMALARGVWRDQAAQGRAHRWLAAHDDPDRGTDRDAGRIWAPICAGRRATSSRPRTTPRRRSPRRAFRSSPSRARRWRNTGITLDRIFQFEDGGANMILDDGGDATLYILLGARVEEGETDLIACRLEEEVALFKADQPSGWPKAPAGS